MKKDIYLSALSFEMTRRCNLKCDWCSRGQAQNMDITKEIIDKTLDEVSDMYIGRLELFGGEPFLNPEGIVYLTDEIIKRNIKINNVLIISNGTIKNNKIAKSLNKLANYCYSVFNKYKSFYNKINKISILDDIISESKRLYIFFSTYNHDNESVIYNVMNYYKKEISSKWCYIQDQYTHYNEKIIEKSMQNQNDIDYKNSHLNENMLLVLEGLAEENYKKFLINSNIYIPMKLFCKFNLIDDRNNDINIVFPCSISANGNVHVQKLMPYKKIDTTEYLFNVLNCKNNFYKLIDDWCWKHPLNLTCCNSVGLYLAYIWLKDRGLNNSELDLVFKDFNVKKLFNFYENMIKNAHVKYPFLSHMETEEITMKEIFIAMVKCGYKKDELRKIFALIMMTSKEDKEEIIKSKDYYVNVFYKDIYNLVYKNNARKRRYESEQRYKIS